MFFEIAGSSVVSQVVQLITGYLVDRDVLWNSRVFCCQSLVLWDDRMSCGQRCSLEQQGVLSSVSGLLR